MELERWLSGFRKIYVVTSKTAAKISGALGDVVSYLERSGIRYEIFDGVTPNPAASQVDVAAERIWRFGAEAVIGIGGGSVIDTAKLASVIVTCGGRAYEYLKREREVCGALKLAAVNLTHGTGSEVDRVAVATVDETHEKVSIASEYMYPSISIDDPRYLVTLPRNQTIYTALDAFYHAIESSTSRVSSPFTRTLGETSVQLIVKWLPVAVRDPGNLEARYWLLYASALSGIAVDNSRTHLIHAIEHVLSGLEPSLPHGAGLAMLGPVVTEMLYTHQHDVLYNILKYIDPNLTPDPGSSRRVADAIRRFQMSVGFRELLTDYGFTAEVADRVAEIAMRSMKYLLDLAPLDIDSELIKKIYLNSIAAGQR